MAPVPTTESDFEQKLQKWMNDLRDFAGRAVITPQHAMLPKIVAINNLKAFLTLLFPSHGIQTLTNSSSPSKAVPHAPYLPSHTDSK